ncbi:peptidoglycan/LPS O-acetylase OafA/YrhL [Arcicella aurantiaca]|uniref:Peptidoglycan/LPS O-acetylase OafA/YrhL n=1 Tax=Arcicella aurantiaca TaxID=591202 RepID=A0A316EC45_9BACT|nr:acyltransferase [Arcicella aurantiaca]PWK26927.1 peptidoglycan/LPS O-acetylase OafA/YrhL [Arcicella aurantiaca]
MSSTKNSLFFPNLNGVRFIAAFWVIIHHIEQFKDKFGFANHIFYTRFIRMIGPLSVFLFFVLSGFLITSLLFVEKERTNTIDIKSFYMRRVLRIWPLYFLTVILGLFVLPQIPFLDIPDETASIGIDFTEKIILYVLILPNVVTGVFKHIPYLSQNWSIGVEEQFYYFWPWVIRQTKPKRLLVVMVFFLVTIYIVRSLTVLYMPEVGLWKYLNEFIKSLRLTCMILGAIGAYFTYYHLESKLVKLIFHRYFQIGLYALLLGMLIIGVYLPGVNQEVYAFIFTLILMNLAKNPDNILNLENPVFDYLGKITYGMYMYHTIAVVIGVKISMAYNQSNWVSYPITYVLTIIISAISYEFFEKPFLTLKDKFTTVKSGK